MTNSTLFLAARFAPSAEGVFEGHAAVFGDRNAHNEIVVPGAFKRTLGEHKTRGVQPPLLLHHDRSKIAGVWTELSEDKTGLFVRGQLALNTTLGREAFELASMGALSGISIGFRERGSKMDRDGTLMLTDIDLVEISLVALPSADKARIQSVRADTRGIAAFTRAAHAAAISIKDHK
jgi:HK97 family phage prohead protease